MKKLFVTLLALVGLVQAQIVTVAGRTQWGDSLRWGDADDSTGYLRIRGQTKHRDSSGTWRALMAGDSCSLPVKLGFSTLPNAKLELSYEVRTSSGNTDSSQVKLKIDSRYCRGVSDTTKCESWVPAGRFRGDTSSFVMDSLITVATTSGTTWKPTRQLFDVPGGTQIRFCVDGFKTGTSATDTTFFRRFVVRTSSVPAGGIPPSAVSISGVSLGTVDVSSSALPTGAATSSNQTGGSQKTQVVDGSGNVIGATSNALDVNIKSGASSGAVAQGSTTSGQTGSLTQGAVTTAAPSYTTAQTSPLSLTTGGALRVDASAQTLTVGSHAVTNAGTFAVQAAQSGTWNVTNISGTVSLPTGAATAAKQPALGTAGSSSTDVISVQGIASGTALPISVASLPLPSTAATSTKQSDGTQKTQIVDGSGNVIASTSNNLNVQCANCSGSGASAADAASFTAGSSTMAPAGGFFQTTATSNALTTGQQGMWQMTANRAGFVNLRNASGTEIGTSTTPVQVTLANTGSNATAVKVDGSAVTQPVSISGNQAVNTAQINGVTPLMGNGVTGTGSQRVTIASDNTAFSVNAVQSGTWTVQPGNTANTTAWKVDGSAVNQPVVGAAAHGASVSGNPVLGGMEARSSDGTIVTNGQAVRTMGTVDGKVVVKPHAIRASTWTYAAASGGITGTTAATMKTAAGAGIRACLTGIQVINAHATVSTEVVVRDGAAGTVLHRGWAQAAGGGFAANFDVPICGTANTLMEVADITTGAAVYVNAQGYTSQE